MNDARLGFLGTVVTPSRRAVAPELHPHLPPGTMLRAYPTLVPAFPATPVERALQAIGHLEAGLRATKDEVDALVIDSVGDYGLDALRAALTIPVVGAGEAGFTAATAGGRRFSIVSVWPASMNFVPQDLLRSYGLEHACLGIRNVGLEGDLAQIAGPDGYLERIRRAERTILAAVLAEVAAAASQGADAVMLGCTCMSPMAEKIADATALPIINPLKEAALKALALSGTQPAGASIRTTRAGLVERMVAAVAGEEPEDCPVCVIGEVFA